MPELPLPDARIHYEILGIGPQFVALHGGLGLDSSYLRQGLDGLAKCFTVVFPDTRGHGHSDRVPLEAATMDTLVADLEALRQHLGSRPLMLLGHSFGGFLALAYALRHPEALRGLVLVATAPSIDFGAEVPARLAKAPHPEAVHEFLEGEVEDDASFARWMQAVAPLYFHGDPARFAEVFQRMRYTFEGLQLGNRIMESFDVRDRLGEIRVPTLVLGGRHDFMFPPEVMADFEAIPDATFHVFEASGHLPFLEEPETFQEVILDWARTRGWI